jgi:hypothetical protein
VEEGRKEDVKRYDERITKLMTEFNAEMERRKD